MAKQAKVIQKSGRMTPNGRESVTELRAGEKGTGKVLGSVISWPWSASSEEEADRVFGEIERRAEANGYKIIR